MKDDQETLVEAANGPELPTADELLAEIVARGGRVHRMREVFVFVITTNPETAQWLVLLGARPYLPRQVERALGLPLGAYVRARGEMPEWDLYIHTIPVAGERTIWQAAGLIGPTVDATDYA